MFLFESPTLLWAPPSWCTGLQFFRVGLHFHPFHPHLSKNSSQSSPDMQYLHTAAPTSFHQQTLDCIFLTAELPATRFYTCLLVKVYYLFEQSHQCVSGSFAPAHDVFLLHLNHPGCMVMSDGKSLRRQREKGMLGNGICWHDVWVFVCGEDDRTAQSEIRGSWLTPYSWSMSSGLSRKSGYPVITIMCFSWERRRRRECDGGKEKVEEKQLVQHHPTSTCSN